MTQYPGHQVVFLEYAAGWSPAGDRESRFKAAFGASSGYTAPMAMTSSGFRWTQGPSDYINVYRGMIQADLPRPPQVDLRAWVRRVGDTTFRHYFRLHNTSQINLHGAANEASLWALAWQDTGATGMTGVPAVTTGRTVLFFVEPGVIKTGTVDLSVTNPFVDWDKLYSVALVEYRPGGTTGPYDVLHAVRPEPASFSLSVADLHFHLPEGGDTAQVGFDGPPVLQWSALAHAPWIQVTPEQGDLDTPAQVRIVPLGLPSGVHEGSVTFSAHSTDGMLFDVELPVTLELDQAPAVEEFPGVAGLPGANQTQWRSSATLFNPAAVPQPVTLDIAARDTGVLVGSRTATLAPGELLAIPDLYQDLGAPAGAGTLRLTGDALAWVRTFNQGEEGTFGQDVTGTAEGHWPAGTPVAFPIITPANLATDFRSNLLLLNLEDHPIAVAVTAGAAALDITVPGRTYVQRSNIGQSLGLAPGPALVAVTADGAWTGSVSTIDPFKGDPTTVRGLPLPPAAGQPALAEFPGVASQPGVNQTRWRSSATLFNPHPEPAGLTLAILARDTGALVASREVVLAPGELWSIPDLYQDLGAPAGAGTLRLAGDILAWVRTFNQGDEGTFGQDVVSTGEGAFTASQVVAFPVTRPADPDTEFRSNLLLLNLEERPIAVVVRSGSAQTTITVPGRTYVQRTNIGQVLGLPPGPALIHVDGDGSWTGSVSTVDPVTGDPTTVRGRPVSAPEAP